MSLVCHSYVTLMYSYVIRVYSYVLRVSFACTRVSSLCHSYVLVCHPYVARMYSYVIRMSLICTSMSFVCHSSVVLPSTVVQKCSVKKMFLKISQNSQESTCVRVYFLMKLRNFQQHLFSYRTSGGCFCQSQRKTFLL